VIFNPDNGADSMLVTIVADTEPLGELPAFERRGYTFGGWFEQLDYIPGDVNYDGKVTVDDALQVLRFLVGLPSVIDNCEKSRKAALIVSRDRPQVDDALQILRFLVGLPNALDNFGEPVAPQTIITADITFVARWAAIAPSVPADFTVTTAGRTFVLNWDTVEWADGYEVMRSDSRLGTYSRIATITSGSISVFRDDISSGNRWFYTVRAFRDTNKGRLFGGYSEIVEGRV
jgi:hypothetical protein